MSEIIFSPPSIDDAKEIHTLIQNCPPLDVNSQYLYLVLSRFYYNTCTVAKLDGKVIGCVTGFIPPNRHDTFFLWQVAVDDDHRGKGLAGQMLLDILQRSQNQNVKFIEATVTPSNKSSKNLFKSISEQLDTDLFEAPLFTQDDFGSQVHEEENLVRVGPFKQPKVVEVMQ